MISISTNKWRTSPELFNFRAAKATSKKTSSFLSKAIRVIDATYADKYDLCEYDILIVGSDYLLNTIIAYSWIIRNKSVLIYDATDRGMPYDMSLLNSSRYSLDSPELRSAILPILNDVENCSTLSEFIESTLSFLGKNYPNISLHRIQLAELRADTNTSLSEPGKMVLWANPRIESGYKLIDSDKSLKQAFSLNIPTLEVENFGISTFLVKNVVLTTVKSNFNFDECPCSLFRFGSNKYPLDPLKGYSMADRVNEIKEVVDWCESYE